MGLIDNIDKYLMVLNTGDLNQLTDGKIDNLNLIRSENEAMVRGESPQAVWSEKHSMHIKEHMEVLNDVELKKDPELAKIILDHVQEHVNLLRTTDPAILSMIGEVPLAPAPNPENMGQQNVQGGGQPVTDTGTGNATLTQPQSPVSTELPSQPKPAGEGTILPPQPTKIEEM